LAEIDIVIPVYNEGENIVSVLDAFQRDVKSSYRILICYDFDEDNTLQAISAYPSKSMDIVLVKNPGRGPHSAIKAGFDMSTAPAVMTHMADDDYNTDVIDFMLGKINEGFDIVTASRFMSGGYMEGCVWYKKLLTWVVSITLHYLARLPVHDATNGVRIFSRRIVDSVAVESTEGFTYTFEMIVKCARLGWGIYELPGKWIERGSGFSRFQIIRWMRAYLRWYFFAFATTWLKRGPETVPRSNIED
jgi:dolichol-phosphate mannosyltransferase